MFGFGEGEEVVDEDRLEMGLEDLFAEEESFLDAVDDNESFFGEEGEVAAKEEYLIDESSQEVCAADPLPVDYELGSRPAVRAIFEAAVAYARQLSGKNISVNLHGDQRIENSRLIGLASSPQPATHRSGQQSKAGRTEMRSRRERSDCAVLARRRLHVPYRNSSAVIDGPSGSTDANRDTHTAYAHRECPSRWLYHKRSPRVTHLCLFFSPSRYSGNFGGTAEEDSFARPTKRMRSDQGRRANTLHCRYSHLLRQPKPFPTASTCCSAILLLFPRSAVPARKF